MAQAPTIDVIRLIDEQKIGKFHYILIIVSFLTVMVDGFDIGAAAFAAPALMKEWSLRPGALGPLFSAGLIAGLFGPPVLGYISDRYGRRLAIIGGVAFFGVFTLMSVWVTGLEQLIYLRFIAGLGIAGVLAITVALNIEFAPRRLRATLFVIMFSGVTFGGGLPGLIASRFMGTYGWQILFWVGGIVPLLVAVLLAFVLPESAKFLTLRPARHGELAQILHRLNPALVLPANANFVLAGEEGVKRFSLKALFAGRLAVVTPLFWICNAVNLMIFYFVNQWMPTLLANAGVPISQAVLATTLFQFGGTVGGLVIMRPLDKYGFIPVPILFAFAIPIIACIGLTGLSQTMVLTFVTLAGFCLLGLQFGNIASESNVYPTAIRSFGVGSCFAAGRVGSVIGPLVGGFLIDMKISLQQLFFIASIPLVLGLIAACILTPLYYSQYHRPGAEAEAKLRQAKAGA